METNFKRIFYNNYSFLISMLKLYLCKKITFKLENLSENSEFQEIFNDNRINENYLIDENLIKKSNIPAVTHVDYSARIQTVSEKNNPLYHKLLTKFKEKTNCPVLVNTSFNIRGEPIVHTPEDAFRCFMGTELDVLVVGNYYLKKDDQNQNLKSNYIEKFDYQIPPLSELMPFS